MAAVVVLALAVVGTTGIQAQGHQQGSRDTVVGAHSDDRIAGQYVVVLEDDVAVTRAQAEAERHYGAAVDDVYRSAIKGFSARMSRDEAAALAHDPGVAVVHVDTRFETTVQTLPTGANRVNADASPTAAINRRDTRVNVDVAVIDTGVDLDHPDLNVHRQGARNCSSSNLGANDQNGHGTHVAGTVGALDNRIGVVGVAPGARIWPVRVLDATGSGTLANVICGIDYVTANAAQIEVANMSLGGVGNDDNNCGNTLGDPLHQAVCASVAAGVTYVVAAGNSALDSRSFIPAAYDEVITASALADFNGRPGGGAAATCRPDVDDTFADFSNFGVDVDVIAPGVCIRSTWLNGRYRTLSGTSMSSPHVAGGAALYIATHPLATPADVRLALRTTGSIAWDNADDRDAVQERLLDVTGF